MAAHTPNTVFGKSPILFLQNQTLNMQEYYQNVDSVRLLNRREGELTIQVKALYLAFKTNPDDQAQQVCLLKTIQQLNTVRNDINDLKARNRTILNPSDTLHASTGHTFNPAAPSAA